MSKVFVRGVSSGRIGDMSEFSELPDFTHEVPGEARLQAVYDKGVVALTLTEHLYPEVYVPDQPEALTENNYFRLFCQGKKVVERVPEAAEELGVGAEDTIALIYRTAIVQENVPRLPYVAIAYYSQSRFDKLSLAWVLNKDVDKISAVVISSDNAAEERVTAPMLTSEVDAVEQIIDFLCADTEG